MYRQIVTPKSNKLTLHLPDEFIGYLVEVIAFSIDQDQPMNNKYSWENAIKFFNAHQVDLSKFKFDRNEANER